MSVKGHESVHDKTCKPMTMYRSWVTRYDKTAT